MLKSLKHFFHAPIISEIIFKTYYPETETQYEGTELCFRCPTCGHTWIEVMSGKPVNEKELDSH